MSHQLVKFLYLIFFISCFTARSQVKTHYDSIKKELDSIYKLDQMYRSHEAADSLNRLDQASLIKALDHLDDINASNLKRVTQIIDQYGWLGISEIGKLGNTTLFLVIQHSRDPKVYANYLPLLICSVLAGDTPKKYYALLQDALLIKQGKMQIYGTQRRYDESTKKLYVDLLIDPDNVDKRRKNVGLGLIADYMKKVDVIWDLETFKVAQKQRLQKLKEKNNEH